MSEEPEVSFWLLSGKGFVLAETTEEAASELSRWAIYFSVGSALTALYRYLANGAQAKIYAYSLERFSAQLLLGVSILETKDFASLHEAVQACNQWAAKYGGWAEEAGQ